MGIGAGLVLVAIGAILAFAVNVTVSGVDLAVVGVILMIVGILGIILELALFMPRRRQSRGYEREEPVTRDRYYDR